MKLHSIGLIESTKSNIFVICKYQEAFLESPMAIDLQFDEMAAIKSLNQFEREDPERFHYVHVVSGR